MQRSMTSLRSEVVAKRVHLKGMTESEHSTTERSKGLIVKPKASAVRLATRKDAPIVRSPGRGSLKKALAAGMASRKKQTMDALQRDEVAPFGGWAPEVTLAHVVQASSQLVWGRSAAAASRDVLHRCGDVAAQGRAVLGSG